jgi:hypothetical protein
LFNLVRLVGKRECNVRDASAPQRVDLVKKKRTIANGNDWFWCVDRERAEARAFAASENESLHA